jgi:hypothetical protein
VTSLKLLPGCLALLHNVLARQTEVIHTVSHRKIYLRAKHIIRSLVGAESGPDCFFTFTAVIRISRIKEIDTAFKSLADAGIRRLLLRNVQACSKYLLKKPAVQVCLE